MADTRMNQQEREAFLSDLHVGVLAIPNADGPPLTAPVWYDYEPGGEIWFLTGERSQKGRLLAEGGPVTLVAQREAMPYAYVSVEGVVSTIRPCDREADSRPMAHRYLGQEMGDRYIEGEAEGSVRVTIRPTRWLTVDYGKASLG